MTLSAAAPLRVLHFIDNLGPGGKERQLVELLKGFEAAGGCSSLVVSMTEGVFYAELLGLRSVTVRSLIRGSRKDWRPFVALHRIVREFGPDVIVAWDHMTAVYALPAARLGGVALVNAMIRDAPARLGWTARSRAWLTFPFADLIVANSQAGLDAYRVRGPKVRVIPNGIDTGRFKALEDPRAVRLRLGLGDALVVGMVATFRPWKDQPTLVRAAQQVLQRRPDVVFVFVGEGETLAACRALVAPADAARIRFLGAASSRLESIVNVFDIGVLATFSEGFPNAVLESMALGQPVVATDGGGTRELLIDGETGFLVPPRDATRLAERLRVLLDDAALRDRMGQAGRARVLEEFTLARLTERHRALYLHARRLAPSPVRG